MAELEEFYVALGEQVRRRRQRIQISQAELGRRLSPPVTRASIANIENAKQRVLAHTLVDLAGCLGVALQELLPSLGFDRKTDDATVEAELAQKLRLPPERARALLDQAGHAK